MHAGPVNTPSMIDPHLEIGRKDLRTLRQHFATQASNRLATIQTTFTINQRPFLELLPLLFHINQAALPGFVSTQAPAGLPDYQPASGTLDLARSLFRGLNYRREPHHQPALRALFLMGSVGTMGHSSDSDIDIWLCHGSTLDDVSRTQLRQKADGIETWGRSLGLDVNIFLVDAAAFRRGQLTELSRESSGTAQHLLLLEEFYRSALLLAGTPAFWWLVPASHEDDHDAYRDVLQQRRIIAEHEYLDLGGLGAMQPEEFLGATLWQLYKGIESPYKSLLKLLLLEAYIGEYPRPVWVATQAKQAIHAGQTSNEETDPYLLMYKHIEQYLLARGQDRRVDLARRCLYFKIDIKLSKPHDPQDWRVRILSHLVERWGWSPKQLKQLDRREGWKIEDVLEERDWLVSELAYSYRLLSGYARQYSATSRINPQDLVLLGRKRSTALERRPGKIDWVNLGISSDLGEAHLTLHFLKDAHSSVLASLRWQAFKGRVEAPQQAGLTAIRSAQTLFELLAWLYYNRILEPATRLWRTPDFPLSVLELQRIRKSLDHFIGKLNNQPVPLEELVIPQIGTSLHLFVNMLQDPLGAMKQEGYQLTSSRSDPLSFGAARINLIQEIDQITRNNWGEVITQHYQGRNAISQWLCHHLDSALRDARHRTPHPLQTQVHCFTTQHHQQIEQRLRNMVLHIRRSFQDGIHRAFLLQVEHRLLLVRHTEGRHHALEFADSSALIDYLGQPQQGIPIILDSLTLTKNPLREVLQQNQPGVLQCFFHSDQKQLSIYVVDEQSNVLVQRIPQEYLTYAIIQYRRFLSSLALMRHITESMSEAVLEPLFYRLGWNAHEQSGFSVPLKMSSLSNESGHHDLRLMLQQRENAPPVFSVCYGQEEFSPERQGDHWAQAITTTLRQARHNKGHYPIYLSSVEWNLDQQPQPSTIEILRLKMRVEDLINQVAS